MEEQLLKLYNGNIITPFRTIKQGTIILKGSTILEISERNIEVPGAKEVNVEGKYISPGFIDIHVHGGGGHDFMDADESAFLAIAKTHAKFGTTSMVATTLTSDKDNIKHTIRVYEKAAKINKDGAEFLGLHLEGPYFSMAQRGAQDPRYIRDPDPNEYEDILASTKSIVRWSAAPERKGALKFGRKLRERGILPAFAHTEAVYDDIVKALENGYTLATHLYSGMLGTTRKNAFRHAGAVESSLLIDNINVELIADGCHLPVPLLQLVYKCKGADKIALITDAMRAAGMPPGKYILGNKNNGIEVIVEDDVAKLPDRSSFAGSVATTDRLIRTMAKKAEIPLSEAIKMMSSTPASIMGISDKKGSLSEGKDADIILFDDDIKIAMTIVNGKIIYNTF